MKFTGNETIAEILEVLPEAGEILYAHGLGCVGCAMGQIESLNNGALAHGFSEDEIKIILADLNAAFAEKSAEKK